MKVLSKLTIENLKLNKSRTIATVIGIILSTAMLVCVFTLTTTILSTYEAAVIEGCGDYHVAFSNVPADEVKQISLNKQVESSYIIETRPSLSIPSMSDSDIEIWKFDKNAFKGIETSLTEGRFPENESEILVGYSDAFIDTDIGDELNFQGESPYTVVGKLLYFEGIIMFMSEPKNEVEIYVKLKNLNNIDEFILNVIGQEEKYEVSKNTYLIATQSLSAALESRDDFMMLYYLLFIALAILVSVIIVVSTFCIRNSFAVSINEKLRQYAMLSSVGATRKQITENILLESLILGLFAIPIGTTIGALSAFVLVKVAIEFFGSMLKIVFCITPFGVAFAILMSFITILLSSITVAIRVSRSCEIDLIKNASKIKITRKSTKVPKIIEKLFGVGGVIAFKNVKRNNRKFRVTTITLIVSIVAFVVSSYSLNLYCDLTMDKDFSHSRCDVSVAGDDMYYAIDHITSLVETQDYTITYLAHKTIKPENKKLYYKDIDVFAYNQEAYDEYLQENSIIYDENKLIIFDEIKIWNDNSERVTVNYLDYIGQKDSFEIAGVAKSTDERAFDYIRATELPKRVSTFMHFEDSIVVLMSPSQFEKYIKYDFETNTANNLSGVSINAYINCSDAYSVTNSIEEYAYNNRLSCFPSNEVQSEKNAESSILLISIVCYLFVAIINLVGLTSIYNSLASSLNLRKKEFAILQSIGMTTKNFNKTISFECIYYVTKSIFISIPITAFLTFKIYTFLVGNDTSVIYQFPLMQTILFSAVVFIVVYGIMKTSLNKISKQNVIETIRQENV